MATYLDGNRRKATVNTLTAMRNSAERRRCLACGRKSALRSEREDWGDKVVVIEWCRWIDEGLCDFRDVRTLIDRTLGDR